MSLGRLLLEADLAGLGIVSWRYDDDGVFCFAQRAPIGSVTRGANGRDALYRLLRRLHIVP